ncbi:MAG: diaminopimelate epimerase [bacterium]
MSVHFTKMSGAGNDFIVIDNRESLVRQHGKVARKLCDRKWGIGADGLLLLENSKIADFRMRYYNADGSYGGMCGNGGRCISLFAFEEGIVKKAHRFEALGHIYRAIVSRNEVSLVMKNPSNICFDLEIPFNKKRIKAVFLNTGSPHVVVVVSNLKRTMSIENVDVLDIGRSIRNMKSLFKEGTNVNFIERKKDGTVHMRTYERGVEDETLACGTGSIACAITAAQEWELNTPIKIVTRSRKILTIDYDAVGKEIKNVILRGPALTVFKGVINVKKSFTQEFFQ